MSPIAVRAAGAADAPLILELIRALAAFERMPEAVVATEAGLRAGLAPPAAFECLIATLDGRPAGFALFYHNFSTWTGRRGIFLEDLFVQEWARGDGVGAALMRAVARVAVERGCPRLDLQVLDWNPARHFYERLGFEPLRAWLPYRLAGDALPALAAAPTVERSR
jgi:GNAT superfamily N-acetyltransferase